MVFPEKIDLRLVVWGKRTTDVYQRESEAVVEAQCPALRRLQRRKMHSRMLYALAVTWRVQEFSCLPPVLVSQNEGDSSPTVTGGTPYLLTP
jgi:hypothetical protein